MTPASIEPVTLRGASVRLEPLTREHVPALAQVGLEPELWRLSPTAITTLEDMRSYVAGALEEQGRGVSLPFAIVDIAGDRAIGSTRFGNIDLPNRHVEIGWTWLTSALQRTAANTETKYLLLRHAFELLGMNRVEFKTDVLNEKSRNAIERLGAVREGIFRRHIVTSTGRVRDSIYYSILDAEWPAVKARLEDFLRTHAESRTTSDSSVG